MRQKRPTYLNLAKPTLVGHHDERRRPAADDPTGRRDAALVKPERVAPIIGTYLSRLHHPGARRGARAAGRRVAAARRRRRPLRAARPPAPDRLSLNAAGYPVPCPPVIGAMNSSATTSGRFRSWKFACCAGVVAEKKGRNEERNQPPLAKRESARTENV